MQHVLCKDKTLNDCDPHASCHVDGISYKCVCPGTMNDTSNGTGRKCQKLMIASTYVPVFSSFIVFSMNYLFGCPKLSWNLVGNKIGHFWAKNLYLENVYIYLIIFASDYVIQRFQMLQVSRFMRLFLAANNNSVDYCLCDAYLASLLPNKKVQKGKRARRSGSSILIKQQ